ncbi:hypothetical protein [Exiguobacterium algae]|uniref:hypothetical protein n=1 Tax=Exiguobacterium algae TaxID=2751250 RepID=UPI001BEBAD2E|nr:hypothetical protein [Exiguobacterium algae]
MDFFFYVTAMVIVVSAIGANTIIRTSAYRVEQQRLKIEEEKLALKRMELEMKREQDKIEHHGF